MKWFTDDDLLRQEVTRNVLNGLPDDLPGVRAAREAAAAGLNFYPALRQAWEQFKQQLERQEFRLQRLESDLRQQTALVEQYRNNPVDSERDALRLQVASLSARAEQAEQDISGLLETHQRHMDYSQQEISRLQALLAEQNRVIAKQQLLLNDLDGDAA